MPTPESGESHDDFMARCVPMLVDEGREQDQAVAICNSMFEEHKTMAKQKKPVIAISAPVTIAAAADDDGDGKKHPPKFESTFYTGVPMDIAGWDLPVVIDLAGLSEGKVLVANLDHDPSKRVGNFSVANDGKSLVASGTASAATPWRDEVVNSAAEGYQWQASLEVYPANGGVELLKAGKTAEINGRQVAGPAYVTRKGTLKGFAFVSHGADDSTSATIAAKAASTSEADMNPEFKKWVEAMGFDPEELSETQRDNLLANFEGRRGATPPSKAPKLDDLLAAKKAETERVDAITEIAGQACDRRPYDIDAIKKIALDAVEGKWTVEKFRLELLEASVPPATSIFTPRNRDERLNGRTIEAAICLAGGLKDAEKQFDDRTLQAAHDRFRNGIGLKQLFLLAAEANGYRTLGGDVDINVQRAAFGMTGPNQLHPIAASGFSTIVLPNTLSNTANKFLREGFMAVDQTPLRIAAIRNVRDFKTITTVSLVGGLTFEEVGPTGEIKHGTLGEETYTNKADTYGRMLAITRTDIVNDDLSALTTVPRRLGRGAMLKLNDIFWTAFLNNSAFFTSARANVSTVEGTLGLTGLSQAETIFMNQTDPDGNPLGSMPAILLVPTALKTTALQLMTSEKIKGDADEPDGNVWRGRFRVESSPYMSNATYTGNSAIAWYLLADPADIPVIEIAALNGRVEPTVETADADFNVLGVQMRGYSDVGVALQEYRGGVRADGSAA